MKSVVRFALSAILFVSLFAAAPRAKADDIVDVAVAASTSDHPQFKTLVAALKATDLVDTLKGDGPFTVFAPTDAAFAKLPAGTLASLLKPENKSKLVAILTYHVLKGKVEAKDVLALKSGTRVETVSGKKVTVKVSKHGVFVNKSKVVKTDIEASNGVIHVIDTVLIPAAEKMSK